MENKLPSAHQINEPVVCHLLAEKYECRVNKIHFDETKVMYDLAVGWVEDDGYQYTRIYNVDSAFVSKK